MFYRKVIIGLVVLGLGTPGWAESSYQPIQVPLMKQGISLPTKAISSSKERTPNRYRRTPRRFKRKPRRRTYPPRQRQAFGFELGMIGSKNNTHSDLLGMGLVFGGRAVGYFPFYKKTIFIKPSLGFFTRAESVGTVSITQQRFEAAAALFYVPNARAHWHWRIGLTQKLELLRSPASIKDMGGIDTPASLRYQLGPIGGFSVRMDSVMSFTSDLEITFPLDQFKAFIGLSVGVLLKF